MTRNLKVLFAAATVLGVFSMFAASGAQAAEFHCSVEPCRVTMKPDGTGKTAHHVISFTNGKEAIQTTCNAVTGEATMSGKTSSELTVSNIKGETCTIAGAMSTLTSNGCHYLIKSAGTLTITCPAGKEIENNGVGCNYNIPPQGPIAGVGLHNIGSTEVTAELKAKLTVNATGIACPWGAVSGEFVTGNVLLTSETDPGGVMSNISWE
jgi:hypothetical protein